MTASIISDARYVMKSKETLTSWVEDKKILHKKVIPLIPKKQWTDVH